MCLTERLKPEVPSTVVTSRKLGASHCFLALEFSTVLLTLNGKVHHPGLSWCGALWWLTGLFELSIRRSTGLL